jgi:hypothetical protein
MQFTRILCFSLTAGLLTGVGASAQVPPAPYVPPAPILNPSTSHVVPPPGEVPVSPSISRTAPGSLGGTGAYLNGTNQVVNPPHSVLRSNNHRHRHHAARWGAIKSN